MNETPEVAFLIEEYKNIAATHDKLRDVQIRLFNYFLLLSAFPFTVAGLVFRNSNFDLLSSPKWLHVVFVFAGLGNLLLTLALIDARLGQYRYARTVNLIRKYFADKNTELSKYLFLPTSADVPSWTSLGFIGYHVVFMVLVGVLFTGYGVQGIAPSSCVKLTVGVAVGIYLALFLFLHLRTLGRYKKSKGIK